VTVACEFRTPSASVSPLVVPLHVIIPSERQYLAARRPLAGGTDVGHAFLSGEDLGLTLAYGRWRAPGFEVRGSGHAKRTEVHPQVSSRVIGCSACRG